MLSGGAEPGSPDRALSAHTPRPGAPLSPLIACTALAFSEPRSRWRSRWPAGSGGRDGRGPQSLLCQGDAQGEFKELCAGSALLDSEKAEGRWCPAAQLREPVSYWGNRGTVHSAKELLSCTLKEVEEGSRLFPAQSAEKRVR